MFKNTASQSIALYAFDSTTNAPKTGDALNIVFYGTGDWGATTAITSNSGVPTEIDSTNAKGWYKIALSQAETNANAILFTGKSVTGNVVITGQLIQTLPSAFGNAGGAAGGILIAGANSAATSFTAGMTISNASGDALSISASGGNGYGINILGNGSSAGVRIEGGATGHGMSIFGGATSGDALYILAQAQGAGIYVSAAGSGTHHGIYSLGVNSGSGVFFEGGNAGDGIGGVGHGVGAGMQLQGGNTAGPGFLAKGGGGGGPGGQFNGDNNTFNGIGLSIQGRGTKAGLYIAGDVSGPGLEVTGGATSGDAMFLFANNTSGHAANLVARGTAVASHGLNLQGGHTPGSHGLNAFASSSSNGHGMSLSGNGTGNGLNAAGGASGLNSNNLNANITAVNYIVVNGDGQPPTPWGP